MSYIDQDATAKALLTMEKSASERGKSVIQMCVRKVLGMFPADVVKRERGEWVFVYRDPTTKLEWHECSICKRMMHYYPWSERDNFCPCCGAKMKGE